MANVSCNSVLSTSTQWNNGVQITQSSTYAIHCYGVSTNNLDIYVSFLDGSSEYSTVSSYHGDQITTRVYWTYKGWMGPYTYETVSYGYAELGDAGPSDTYGSITDFEATFTNVPSTVQAIKVEVYDSSNGNTSIHYWSCKPPDPTITTQPQITNIAPASGQSTTVSWSAASVTNQGDATIYYQYFVGPSSTYSDNYHIGTTTNRSATITEESIIDKCGASFSGTCYIFVRAYWQKSDGTNGGWVTPAGSAFIYDPHRTVKYYNGSSWVECIVHYFDGSKWIECVPHYHNGSTWVECSGQ